MSTFLQTADSRETSNEIMEAILFIAAGDEALAADIWHCPSEAQLIAVFERATKNGLTDSREFYWGAAGNQWAEDI